MMAFQIGHLNGPTEKERRPSEPDCPAEARSSGLAVVGVNTVPLPLFGFQPYLPLSLFFILALPKRKYQRKGSASAHQGIC
jgi:hypothetical protein